MQAFQALFQFLFTTVVILFNLVGRLTGKQFRTFGPERGKFRTVLVVTQGSLFYFFSQRREERGVRFAFGFLGTLLPLQLLQFFRIFMPLAGKGG